MKSVKVALAGNPNAGKTTLFNALTGSRQHVGNWPGKTVERKHGHFEYDGYLFEVVDLPGTYSLTAYSIEEIVARDYILREKPDVVIAVVDASNLERNLYLVVQILELQANLIIALNMIDRADALGYEINVDTLSARLGGAPAVRVAAVREEGLDELKSELACLASKERGERFVEVEHS